MAAREYKIKGSHILIAVLLIAIVSIVIWQAYFVAPPTVIKPPKYTTGLTVKVKIYDVATYSLKTADVLAEFYPSGTEALKTRTFTTKPVAVAAYDSVLGAWSAPLDAGSYMLLVKDAAVSKTFYPEQFSVTVTGTDSEDKVVWLTPSTVNVLSRATLTLSKTILAYNDTSGAYDITVTNMNYTLYSKWLVTYTFTISDVTTAKITKNGRLYMTKITGLTPTSGSLDGSTATINEDTEAADEGQTGYYVSFTSDWNVGELHRLDVYFEASGASSGTLTLKAFEYYNCWNAALRWWTDQTTSITVTA